LSIEAIATRNTIIKGNNLPFYFKSKEENSKLHLTIKARNKLFIELELIEKQNSNFTNS
jgi:vacuolar-type H+-ATPase subunit B/Vma2